MLSFIIFVALRPLRLLLEGHSVVSWDHCLGCSACRAPDERGCPWHGRNPGLIPEVLWSAREVGPPPRGCEAAYQAPAKAAGSVVGSGRRSNHLRKPTTVKMEHSRRRRGEPRCPATRKKRGHLPCHRSASTAVFHLDSGCCLVLRRRLLARQTNKPAPISPDDYTTTRLRSPASCRHPGFDHTSVP